MRPAEGLADATALGTPFISPRSRREPARVIAIPVRRQVVQIDRTRAAIRPVVPVAAHERAHNDA